MKACPIRSSPGTRRCFFTRFDSDGSSDSAAPFRAGILTAVSGADGSEHWSIVTNGDFRPAATGGVAMGDLDGDGVAEICVSGWNVYMAAVACFSATTGVPTLKFMHDRCFASSTSADGDLGFSAYPNVDSPAIANIDRQGHAEVIALGCVLRSDGTEIAHIPANKRGGALPFAADVHPGSVGLEIIDGGMVYASPDTSASGQTLAVLRDQGYNNRSNDSWKAARPVWNQHAYNVININDDLSVPVTQAAVYDSFRAAQWVGMSPTAGADLNIVDIDRCEVCDANDMPAQIDMYIEVGNGGIVPGYGVITLRDVVTLTPVGAPIATGTIAPGAVVGFEVTLDAATWGSYQLEAFVAPDPSVYDCNSSNDVRGIGRWPWAPGDDCSH